MFRIREEGKELSRAERQDLAACCLNLKRESSSPHSMRQRGSNASRAAGPLGGLPTEDDTAPDTRRHREAALSGSSSVSAYHHRSAVFSSAR